jgi:hypothetical protein
MTEELLSRADSFKAFIRREQAVMNEGPLNPEEYRKRKRGVYEAKQKIQDLQREIGEYANAFEISDANPPSPIPSLEGTPSQTIID